MNMEQFILQEWHILVLFMTLVISIVKTDIVKALNSLVLVLEQRKMVGKKVLLHSGVDGSWKEIRIESYQIQIPFIRSGGVFISHLGCEIESNQEKMSFETWMGQRIRTL